MSVLQTARRFDSPLCKATIDESEAMSEELEYVTQEDVDFFWREGYHIVTGFLSPEEAKDYRMKINKVFGFPEQEIESRELHGKTYAAVEWQHRKTYAMADGVTKNRDFWPLIFNRRLRGTVGELLGGEIRYTQHSDLSINLGGGRYHRDGWCREFGVGPDWDDSESPFAVVRIVFYLSDYDDSDSAIIVLPGTHMRESKLNRYEYIFWNRLRVFLRKHNLNEKLPHFFFSGPKVTHKTKPGDCVIFHQRLLHAGGTINGRMPKYAAYLSFGLDNHHSRNHRNYFLNIRDNLDYLREIPSELKDRLKLENLLLE